MYYKVIISYYTGCAIKNFSTLEEAKKYANQMRKAKRDANIWECSDKGARKIDYVG